MSPAYGCTEAFSLLGPRTEGICLHPLVTIPRNNGKKRDLSCFLYSRNVGMDVNVKRWFVKAGEHQWLQRPITFLLLPWEVQSHSWGTFHAWAQVQAPARDISITSVHQDSQSVTTGCHLTPSWGLIVISRMEQWKNPFKSFFSKLPLSYILPLSLLSCSRPPLTEKVKGHVFQLTGSICFPRGGFVPLYPISDKHCKLSVSLKIQEAVSCAPCRR